MCFETFKKIHWKNVLFAALIYLVIAYVIRQIEVIITMPFYFDPNYLSVWSTLMMPEPGPPPLSFTLISIVFTFTTGLVLAALWAALKDFLPKQFWAKVLAYTDIVVALMLVLSFLPMVLLINLPLLLIFSWFITGILTTFVGALIFAKMLK